MGLAALATLASLTGAPGGSAERTMGWFVGVWNSGVGAGARGGLAVIAAAPRGELWASLGSTFSFSLSLSEFMTAKHTRVRVHLSGGGGPGLI